MKGNDDCIYTSREQVMAAYMHQGKDSESFEEFWNDHLSEICIEQEEGENEVPR